MKINKIAIFCTGGITIIGLCGAIYMQVHSCFFISNLFAGVFTSGLLTLLMSIIGYFVERRKTLEKFYTYATKAASNFNLFEDEGDLDRSIDSILQMNQFDYVELDNAYGDMDFIFGNKRSRKYIFDKIYLPILNARNTVTEKCFHFKEYKKATHGNSRVMRDFISEISKILMSCTEQKSINEYGVSMVIKSTHNKFVEDLHRELNGEYYKITYPYRSKKHQEET